MAFGSTASTKVKVILEAQDKVSAQLNRIKANFAKADQEMQARAQQRQAQLSQYMASWDKIHPQSTTGWYNFTNSSGEKFRSFEHFTPERLKALGMYNPYIAGAHVVAALQTQTSKIYQTAQRFTDGLIKANQWMTKATASLMSAGGKLTMGGGILTGAGIAGLTSLYKPLSQYGDFQRNMLEAQVKSGASAAQYNAMTGAARQYAAGSSWDPQQVSSVMAKMSSMGFKPDQITNSFRQIMDYSRAVGQDDPMWAAQGIGAMMNSFGINAADRGTVSKVIDKMTAAIVNSPLRDDTLREAMKQVAPLVKDKQGTIDDMLAWNMVMAQKGIDGSIAGTAQKNFLMRTGNSKIVDYLGKFGIAVFDDAGNRRSARQILADIAQIKKVMTDKEWDAFAFKVFGARSQSGIGAMFDDNALEQAYSALADAGGLSEQIREQMESGVFGSLKRIWSAIQDMFLEVGKSLENLLKEWEPKIIAWFNWATEMVGDNPRFVQWLADAYKWMVQIGIPLTAIGVSLTVIGGVLSGFQTIVAFLIGTVTKALIPAIAWIFTTLGAVGGALALVAVVLGVIIGKTFRWGKIFQAMFNGGDILHGIKLLGWSLWESLKWASAKFFRLWLLLQAKVAGLLWKGIVLPIYGVMKAASYIPGLSSVSRAADAMLNAPGQMMESGVNYIFDAIDKENERTRKEYFKDLDKYSAEAKAQNYSEASDIEKRGKPVAMLAAMNDDIVMIQRQQREALASAKWAQYFPGTQRPAELEQAEKEIEKFEKAEEKRRKALVDSAFASENAADKEEKAAAKKEAAERKKAISEAKAEERKRQEEERKAKEFKANQLKRQAELTKGMKPLFKGTVEAAKWLHGIGEYSKDAKEEREEEMADNVAGIYDILSSGEGVVFAGV